MLHTCCTHNKFINLHSSQALWPSLCEEQDNTSAMLFMCDISEFKSDSSENVALKVNSLSFKLYSNSDLLSFSVVGEVSWG